MTCALLLYKEHTFPEQINETPFVAEAPDRLLKASHPTYRNTENLKEIAVEQLRLSFLVTFTVSIASECRSARANFIPRKPHLYP